VHTLPGAHGVSAEQSVPQEVPLQVYGAQELSGGVTQDPAPSQTEAGCAAFDSVLQSPGRHTVPRS
jgi:hypothetical protein